MRLAQKMVAAFVAVAALIGVVGYFGINTASQVAALRRVELPMEQSVREIEVSQWEAVQAAEAFMVTGEPRHEAQYRKQAKEIEQAFDAYVSLIGKDKALQTSAAEFRREWDRAKGQAEQLIHATKKRIAAEKEMYEQVDAADDVIDYKIQTEFKGTAQEVLAKERPLREVEVSVWEAIHAATQYTSGAASEERKRFADLMDRQFGDVRQFWPEYVSLATSPAEQPAIREFEAHWDRAIKAGPELVKQHQAAHGALKELSAAIDRATSVIEQKIKGRLEARVAELDDTAARSRTQTIAVIIVAIILAITLGMMLARWVANPMRSAVQGLRASSTQLVAVGEETQRNASDEGAAVEETRRTMAALVEAANDIAEGADSVLKSAERSAEASKSIAERITKLNSQALRITDVSEAIRNIADKSDILALNASLEGTKAGEAGRGFVLVGSEMRRLTETISEAVREIKQLAGDIQSLSQAAVVATENGRTLADETTETAQRITLVTRQQRNGTEQVSKAMDEIHGFTVQSIAGARQTAATAAVLAQTASELSAFLEGGTTAKTTATKA